MRPNFLSDKAYDTLKFVCLFVLPALATAMFTVGSIWDFPNVDKIVGTLVAINALIAAILGISISKYSPPAVNYDGVLHVTGEETYAAIETPTIESLRRGELRLRVQEVPGDHLEMDPNTSVTR